MDIGSVTSDAGKIALEKVAEKAADKFVGKAIDSASKWLTDTFKGHEKKVKENAKENSESFLQEAGKQVQIIVQNSQNSPVVVKLVNDNFSDPDFSAVLQEATIASARTAQKEKHLLLARLIAERVAVRSEDMVSLVSSSAIDAIRKLSQKHLHILGLSAVIYFIRPNKLPADLPPEAIKEAAKNWWNNQLQIMLPNAVVLEEIDMRHLVSVSCIDHDTIFQRDLTFILKEGVGEWDVQKYTVETELGKKLKLIFDSTIQHMTLTSTGMLIGTLVHDQISGQHTTINWS